MVKILSNVKEHVGFRVGISWQNGKIGFYAESMVHLPVNEFSSTKTAG